jgi:hypothetical protein
MQMELKCHDDEKEAIEKCLKNQLGLHQGRLQGIGNNQLQISRQMQVTD